MCVCGTGLSSVHKNPARSFYIYQFFKIVSAKKTDPVQFIDTLWLACWSYFDNCVDRQKASMDLVVQYIYILFKDQN